MWEFETEPEFQVKLDWIKELMREEIAPLDVLFGADLAFARPMHPAIAAIVEPLKQRVKDQGLWACHLGPELGGQGFGQVKLALINEIIGISPWSTIVFGTAAPDTGNAEILAHYGTEEQKAKYLRPLLNGDIVSCYAMTEPQGGADPKVFTTTAVRDGDEWVINGLKFFGSNAPWASFYLVMAITNAEVSVYKGASMFIVPAETPGITRERDMALFGHEPAGDGAHSLIRFADVRVPDDHVLGGEGNAFGISQTRLGGGRVHHAMRTVANAQRALDMILERALSRYTQGSLLADKQAIQMYIAESYAELLQFRMAVMYVAWKIDRYQDYGMVRHDIAAIKIATPKVLHNVVTKCLQVHGALGTTNDMPIADMVMQSTWMGLVDGPTEAHSVTLARVLLKNAQPAEGMWPSEYIPARREAAMAKYGDILSAHGWEAA